MTFQQPRAGKALGIAILWSLTATFAGAQAFEVAACYERCSAEFSPCIGVIEPPDPPVILRQDGADTGVLTPQSFEFCLAVKQACNADFLTSRVAPKE
jgi:hypothetical protein